VHKSVANRTLHLGIGHWVPGFDKWLILAVICIICLSLVMVTSASIVIAEQRFGNAFYFAARHAIYVGIGITIAFWIVRIPLIIWERYSSLLLLICLLLLIVVLIPGIGRQVNGSTRWLGAGPITVQVSEIAKLGIVLYLSSYLVRRREEVRTNLTGFLKPLILLGFVAFLLLLEPDFGAAVVISTTAMGMMFLGGVRLRQFMLLSVLVLMAMAVLAVSSPYRMLRLTSFLNPWADQFNTGYQLTQALIAFGRGRWFGVGLGNSVQKLLYLPEAHTDFLMAVIAEELGLFGMAFILALYSLLVYRILLIGQRALSVGYEVGGMTAFGLGLWVGIQALINIGVNVGVLPTKGLTLPLMIYGGSSIVIAFVVIGIVLRIDYETRQRWVAPKSCYWIKAVGV